jgi:toxin HigB-1
MIVSWGSKDTVTIWEGNYCRQLPREIQEVARRKLRMINSSVTIADLRIPPANRLEKLGGNLKDYYSIRINDQWRVVFLWSNGNAYDVKIIDYH